MAAVSASASSENPTITMLGTLAPVARPWIATIGASTKMIATATSQCPVVPPIAKPMVMLGTRAPPTKARRMKFL